MTSAPPIILVLDISTLSSTSTREWLGFSRAGACYIPQVVYEEMRFLYERSPDPDLERVARDFNRFYATSGWNITEVTGHHTILKSATGYALTKRMRVALAVARCAYGLSQEHPKSLVVLVGSDRAILQRLYDIQAPNLTGIPGSSLLQWSRTGQRPVAVSQKLQEMKMTGNLEPISSTIAYTHRPTSSSRITTAGAPRKTGPTRTRTMSPTPTRPRTRSRRSKKAQFIYPEWFPQFVSMSLSLIALSCAGVMIWLIFFTNAFDRFIPSKQPQGTPEETTN